MLGCDLHHGVHVGGLAVEMHDHDRLRPLSDGGFDLFGIDVVSPGIDINPDGLRAGERDRARAGDEGARWGDDLVARPDAHRAHAELQG